MTTATAVPRSARPANAQPQRLSLSDVTGKGKGLPSRVILHGLEGVGKTSWAANAPAPVFLMARGETGLETLIDSGRLPEVPHFPECNTWEILMGAIESLATEEHQFKTVVLDTLNGCERLCHESVCARLFNNDWGKQGFTSYQQGFEASLADWRQLLIALDGLRERKKMAVIALCHTKVKTFKNPEGADYDRYQPDMNEKTWGLTHKWADIVLFANFHTVIEDEKKRKAAGGQLRVMHTERRAAFDAKNRAGLPEEIDMGANGKDAWGNFMKALQAGKAKVAEKGGAE